MSTGRVLIKQAYLGKYIRGIKNFKGTNTAKFLSGALDKAQDSGADLIDYLAKHKNPTKNIDLNKVRSSGKSHIMDTQKVKPSLARGFRTSIGNTADAVKTLNTGLKGKGVIEGTKQLTKNVGELTKRQVRGDLYKEVSNPTVYRKGNKKFVKSKAPFLKDREIVSETDRNSAIIRKRKILTPLSVGLGGSGASLGAVSYALDKEKPQGQRIGDAAADAALFTLSPPVGIANIIRRASDKENSARIKKLKQN